MTATLHGPDGQARLESGTRQVPAMSTRQWSMSELFGTTVVEDGFIAFEASLPVFTWGSAVDNNTGDAVFVSGVADDATVRPLDR